MTETSSPSPTAPVDPKSVSHQDRWSVILSGALGGAFGVGFVQGLFGEHGLIANPKPEKIAPLIILFPLTIWILAKFIEPWRARRRAAMGLPVHHPKFKIWRWNIRGMAAIVMVISFEELFAFMAHIDFGWIGAFLICGSVTALWISGARMEKRRAGLLGALGAYVLGSIIVALLFVLQFSGLTPIKELPKDAYVPTDAARELVFYIALGILGEGIYWALNGGFGGLWIDHCRSLRPTIGLLVILLLVTIGHGAIVRAMGVGWLDLVKDLARALGWGIGLIWCASSDLVFRRPAAEIAGPKIGSEMSSAGSGS